jgi:hypothetical protein
MLQYGLNITQVDDPLKKITLERLFKGIVRPKEAFQKQIHRLRLVRSMDTKQYSRLKKALPYFVCGQFHPPHRRRENFSVIRHFMIDLDHFEQAEKDKQEVAQQLQEDDRLLMMFTSPGGDGLKLMYQLSEQCHDAGLYTLFYKAFIQDLTTRFQLEQVIDLRTHDVTRACFMSADPEAYFNPEAKPIVLEQVFDPMDPDARRQLSQERKELKEKAPERPSPKKEALSDEVLQEIKKKLNPNFRPRKKREAFVPPELDSIMPQVEERLREVNMEIAFTEPIHYGKKLRIAAGTHWAEVNVFFGKRGFSVVKTTKTGSNDELADMAHQLLYELLIEG